MLTQDKLKELIDKRARLAAEAERALEAAVERAGKENRDATAEDEQEFDRYHGEIERITKLIDESERQANLAASLAERQPLQGVERDADPLKEERKVSDDEREANKRKLDDAFDAYIRRGFSRLSDEERSLVEGRFGAISEAEARAMGVGTDTAGGFFVPEGFHTQIESAMLAFGGMRRARTFRVPTASGNDLPIPTDNDASNMGAILSENSPAGEQDVTLGQVVLHAYMYTSKIVKVSRQLLQDSAFPLQPWLSGKLGTRIARILNVHFTTGDGAAKPYGVVPMATLGKSGATGQTTSVIVDDLYDLKHSVDPDYRGSAEWMFSDNTLLAIKKLKDGEGRPLWQPGLATGSPNTIDGDQYVINQDVADMAASAKSILYGDFSKYYIRDVVGAQLLRLDERYADSLQVAFLAFSRHDGALVDAGTNPVKFYQNSAS